MPANLPRLTRLRANDSGFTLVEMTVAVTVVLLMAAVALLAAPGIVKDATKSSCNAVADSVNNAITASYASHTNYSRTSAANLVSDNYLVSIPDSDQMSIGSASDDGVTVTFGPSCTGDTAPSTWGADAASEAKYVFGDGGGPTLTQPSVPQNFTATPGDTKIIISWSEPADTGGGPITSYVVMLQETSGGSPVGQAFEPTGCTSLTGSNLTCTATGLTNGTTYDVGIMAMNALHTGSVATVSGVTPHTLSCAEGGTCQVGDTGPGNGKVFYVDDGGFQANGSTQKYLEAAPSAWNGGADPVKNYGCNFVTTGTSDGIGVGWSNTQTLLSLQGTDCVDKLPNAAITASNYTGGGKADWYLPSKAEVNQLCLWAKSQQTGPSQLGTTCPNVAAGSGWSTSASAAGYQSSTETDFTHAWIQDFGSSGSYSASATKNNNYSVRPIRAFAPIS